MVLVMILALAVAALAAAQLPGRDPLTPSEADAIRDAAGNPGKRVDLLLGDAGQRLSRLESLQNSNLPERLSTMHLMLREYREILNELDDNFDEWMSGHTTSEMGSKPKIKKPLRTAIAAEQGFLRTLAAVRAHSSASDLETYRFALSDARDATRGDIQDAQADLTEIQQRKAQEKAAKKKQKKHFPFAAGLLIGAGRSAAPTPTGATARWGPRFAPRVPLAAGPAARAPRDWLRPAMGSRNGCPTMIGNGGLIAHA